MAELGFAMERDVFGGLLRPFVGYVHKGGFGCPLGYWSETEWPNEIEAMYSTFPVLKTPPLSKTQTSYPIQVSL
jgi:hypothetical protein